MFWGWVGGAEGRRAKLRLALGLVVFPVVIILLLAINPLGVRSRLRAFSRTGSHPSPRMAGVPQIVLWAWERPEDLRFIDTRKIGVAYLARTLSLRADRVQVKPRLQPLALAPGTSLIAVVRIEPNQTDLPTFSPGQVQATAASIVELAGIHGIAGIQIDFDARTSAREFYRQLLGEVRKRIPANLPLSITALASWCMYDNWLSGLPVDEVVPMLFRMGADTRQVMMHLQSGGDFVAVEGRTSLGISVDEPLGSSLPSGRRVYVFNPKPWSQSDVESILKEVSQWQ
jgi:hypothetical protein